MKTLLFATSNTHKLREAQDILGSSILLRSLKDISFTQDIPEPGDTIEENSLLKAKFIWGKYGMSCFADDTGLEVDALSGAPGVHSARYAGEMRNHQENIKLLLKNLEGVKKRDARFKTVITFMENGNTHQFEGIVNGNISEYLSGNGGFGYDSVFMPEGYDISFAEMLPEHKNKLSHRALALKKLACFLS